MSRGTPRRSRASDPKVFINCPFDEDFRPFFEALLFAVTASGYKVRCALEDADGASIRFEKLRNLIGQYAIDIETRKSKLYRQAGGGKYSQRTFVWHSGQEKID